MLATSLERCYHATCTTLLLRLGTRVDRLKMHSGGSPCHLSPQHCGLAAPLTGLGQARPHNGLQRLDGEGGQHVSLQAFGAKDACRDARARVAGSLGASGGAVHSTCQSQ